MTTISETEWASAKHLILGDEPQMRVYGEVSIWFKKLELFRNREDERLFRHEPSADDLEIHKNLLQRLIADGDHLLLLIQQVGWPERFEGIKAEDVIAAVETLRDTYRGWHEPMPSAKRDQILKEVFPDVP